MWRAHCRRHPKLRSICARLAQPEPIPTVPKPNVPLAPPARTQTVERAVVRSVNRELILRVVRVSVAHAQSVNIIIPKVRHLAKSAVAEPMPVVPEIPLAPAVLIIIGAVVELGHVAEYK